jgi:hypothetical protein
MGPIENHSDEGWVTMTDQEPMTRRWQTTVIGGERATTEENKQKATTHDVKERRSTKQQGSSLTNRDEDVLVKKSESERR